MKKLILFFFVFLSYNLFSQTWDFMYNEDFLPIEPYSGGRHEYLRAKNIIAHNDEILICRKGYENVIMIYNQTKKEWRNITLDSIYKTIKGEHSYTKYDFEEIREITFDSKERLWGTTANKILCIFQDTTLVFNQVYNTEKNQFLDITHIRDLKPDKKGNIWAIVDNVVTVPYDPFVSLCKFQDSCFVTVNSQKKVAPFVDGLRLRIAFDNFGKVYHTNSDTLYILENDEVVKKIAIWDLPEGRSYFSSIEIDKNNVVYIMNTNMMLYIIDGDNYYSEDFALKSERLLAPQMKSRAYSYMSLDSNDNVWIIGSITPVLYKFDTNRNWTVIDIPQPETATDDFYYKERIAIDKYGKIWIPAQATLGTFGYGIYIYNSDTTISSVEQPSIETAGLPDVWIRNLYPNPANLNATLTFFLERNVSNECKIEIYNTLGMKVKDITEQ
ncbi:MAG: hypothetical protein GX121_10680, partial [Ignavibacteria bacterium]|nr:hypothetical protein [Ignavibacteria bacterium]